jgi:hypothetical protein
VTGAYFVRFNGEPVMDYEFRADIWTGTRAEVRVDNAFYRFKIGQLVVITNEVDRYPEWLRRLVGRVRPGWRPLRRIYAIDMIVEYVTSANRVGLIDYVTWLSKHEIAEV